MSSSRCRSRRARDERGVSVVLVAIFAAVVMLSAAFAVDLGMQRVLRRDLQAVADLVALDLARELSGGPVSDYSDDELTEIDTAMVASLARNDDTLGGGVDPADVDWEFVVTEDDDGGAAQWTAAGPDDTPDGVRVVVHSAVDLPFGGITGVSQGEATRTAVGSAPRVACIAVDSYAAQVAAGDDWLLRPLLEPLLGPAITTWTLTPGTGLAGVDVAMTEVVAELDAHLAGDISALSFTPGADVTVQAWQLLHAAVHVLRDDGRAAEADLLRAVDRRLRSAGVIVLSDVVRLDAAGNAAATLDLDVLDLVGGAIGLLRGATPLALTPPVPLALPLGPDGTTEVPVEASVVLDQAPVVQCEGRVETSRVDLSLTGGVLDVDLGRIAVQGPVTVDLTWPDAGAAVRGVRCVAAGKRVRTAIDSGLLDAEVRLGRPVDDSGSPPMSVSLVAPGVPGWNGEEVATGTVVLTSDPSRSPAVRTEDLLVVDESYDAALPLDPDGALDARLLLMDDSVEVREDLRPMDELLAELQVPTLQEWVTERVEEDLIAPLLGSADSWLLAPLEATLGADPSAGVVRARPTVECGNPRLTG